MAVKTKKKPGVGGLAQADYPGLDLQKHLELFHSGENCRAYEFLGAHPAGDEGASGAVFRVWAPAAAAVSVIGEFNGWNHDAHPMEKISKGVWQAFVPGVAEYAPYKYAVTSAEGALCEKADPYGFHCELRPQTASKFYRLDGYDWDDGDWNDAAGDLPRRPVNIYEVHLGSWRRGENGQFLSYLEMAGQLIPYVKSMGYTHVEFLPVMEHPADESWGYQVTGYYAVTSRYGAPRDFMRLVELCHQAGVGVILDWVPAHFIRDGHGLIDFDGGPCYEYADPGKREHMGWGTRAFDFGRPEVVSFLLSSALFWLSLFHADGLRAGAVAGMIYLDYGRPANPPQNEYGGRENLEALAFLRKLNGQVFAAHPHALMMAEESAGWPMVTMPGYTGGLGFGLKWNTGWAKDTLAYMELEPISRQYHHSKMVFPMTQAFSEKYVLALSHDEVVFGKSSLIEKMPGDYEDKFAGLRAYLAYMMAHPGKKLTFMGAEMAQFSEWNAGQSLDWHLLGYEMHRKFHEYVRELNLFYLRCRPLWRADDAQKGFQWIAQGDSQGNTLSFRRLDNEGGEVICLFNFSPINRQGYRLGLPGSGAYREVMSSNESRFGGWGFVNEGPLSAEKIPCNELQWSLQLDLPPYGAIFLKRGDNP